MLDGTGAARAGKLSQNAARDSDSRAKSKQYYLTAVCQTHLSAAGRRASVASSGQQSPAIDANAGLGSDPHAEVLDFEVFLDAVLRALAPEAGLLVPTERCLGGRDQTGIDAYDTGLEALGDAPHPTEVARVEVGSKAELGVICHPDRFFFGLEAEQRRNRSEGLFLRHHHRRIDVR